MRNFFLILTVIMIFSSRLYPQSVLSVSNVLRYGDGKRSIGNIKNDFRYFENLTDVRLKLPYNITTGFRILYDNPPEVGLKYQGLKRKFVEYEDELIYAKLGNFSQLYGKGLALNLFEARGLGYDTWMDGINFRYKSKYFSIGAIYGTLDFEDSVVFPRNEKYNLRGGNLEIIPLQNFKVGLIYLYSKNNFYTPGSINNSQASIPSLYLNYTFSEFNFSIDYAQKFYSNNYHSGAALYGSVSYSGSGLGIVLDYKNYLFDEKDPFERYDYSRASRMLPFQNPPIVMKEHSYTLLTRAVHEVDFNDEVGFQIEVFYSLDNNTTINLNSSLSSRHNYFEYDPDKFSFNKKERTLNFFPSLMKKYSPYIEFFGEVEHYFNEYTWAKFVLAGRNKILFNEFAADYSHEISSMFTVFQINKIFTDFYSFEGEIEFEKVFDNYTVNQNYYNALLTLINTFWSRLTFTIRYEFTDNKFDLSGKRNWLTIESGFRINSSNTFLISYGTERGGQVCSNGVCRYIQPFEGFRFSLINNF